MVVATCIVTLQLGKVTSLKEKRSIVKPILTRLSKQFNVAVAEIDHQDVWQTAVIALVTVGNNGAHLHRQLEKSVAWLEQFRPDIPIADYSIEIW